MVSNRYVPPKILRVRFLCRLCLKMGHVIDFVRYRLKLGMIFKGTTRARV